MRNYGSYALANSSNPRCSNSLYQSLQTNLGARKVDLDYGVDFLNLTFSNIPTAVSAAKKAGLAIIVLGTLSSFTHADLGFPGAQQQYLDAVLDASILAIWILSGGQPFVLNDSTLRSNAIPRFFLCGEFTGDALADILTGEVNHSGKLPISLPQDSSATPAFHDYHGRDDTGTADSLLGSHSTYQFPLLLRDTPMPFGFGLGYTTFSVSIPIVEAENEVIGMRLNITNTGSIPGEEVVQIYHRPHRG
ncbi:glycoside hydrolase family 3 C-terminal domain-containing protein [Aspergillus pseudonomiae]|uniref:beta-glucosidase n=1 Tax=Aspergillus pseudonomiae TaxID=1506151 RepID=A0A5N7D7D7_9EURO|nr:glycoside hydrolase family 3 C-terminal domain-containing protein [Aspergillus pseudonomiae]KAB8262224.1 glycoside hydrolase family 3 C-terminal domain-containing protein [Aspergillus pseudonomiae]KAE8401658.1 glycoside hydrolase family 3 C-terminal domain-containing protein [Aspergillus pseudonomiae]